MSVVTFDEIDDLFIGLVFVKLSRYPLTCPCIIIPKSLKEQVTPIIGDAELSAAAVGVIIFVIGVIIFAKGPYGAISGVSIPKQSRALIR